MQRSRLHRFVVVLLLLTIWVTEGISAPDDLEKYDVQRGGFVDLPLGAVVEGSLSHGGLQPDYRIDPIDPQLIEFLANVSSRVENSPVIARLRERGSVETLENEKIKLVTALVSKALPGKAYDTESYLETLNEHRSKGIDIQIGAYLTCRAGVCRENALLVHQALKAVGVPNKFVYAKAKVGSVTEDHAFVVIERNGEKWIVDPYNKTFHGRPLSFVMKARAARQLPPKIARYARRNDYVGRILKINDYPVYWISRTSTRCRSLNFGN